MASYTVNQQALERARQLIDARQYVLKSIWNDVQPSAADENASLEPIPGRSTPTGTWPSPTGQRRDQG